MTISTSRFLAAILIGGALLLAPAASFAAQGDCGQPTSSGDKPSAPDAQTILKAGVGQPTVCDAKPCVCDVNSSKDPETEITATDALLTLQVAVGQEGKEVTCTTGPCGNVVPPPGFPCTSAEFLSRSGSDLDSGWTGVAHNSDLIEGARLTFRTQRRCSDSNAICNADSECASDDCKPTCDCLPGGDPTCEVTGPSGQKNCVTTLAPCENDAGCPAGVKCSYIFGPPLPLSSGGTPVCVLSLFDGGLTGTANSETGEAVTSANLKSRVFLGIELGQPCPRCGPPEESPKIGDAFSCEGGQFDGEPCTVNGVSPNFGGTSFDCPPMLNANISGTGLTIRFREVTTGTSSRTAQLPCTNFGFTKNPLNPATQPKCLDKVAAGDPVCTSNADCKRCTGDATIACTGDGECTGHGTCAEAPDQPITCGTWCQCGFCGGDATLPCFQNMDCPEGINCEVGPGSGTNQNAPQLKPNDCSGDKFICGETNSEQCATTQVGKCSEQTYRNCNEDATCIDNNAGLCVFESRPCFESRITRTGVASPIGSYCAFEDKTCTNNSDCSGADDFCSSDASRPKTVALFCVPATLSASINNAGGITGPGAVTLNSFVRVCRCGDGQVGCDEQCDDANTANGDGCDDFCQDE